MAVIRSRAPGSEEIADWGDQFVEYVGWLSDYLFSSNWETGIEYLLWERIRAERGSGIAPESLPELPEQLAEDVRFLSNRSGGWPYYNERNHSTRVIPIERWRKIFGQWKHGRT